MKKIYVVGIGPGEYEQMTIRAVKALESCDVIIGYTVYVDLVREHFAGKEFLTTPMKQEVERCRMAFEKAEEGKTTAMICSGDAGVYGMSGLMLEIGQEYPDVEVECIPGVTAAIGGAAVLGAPLIHDFALISLSDLLTPWEKIEKRLLAAAAAAVIWLEAGGSQQTVTAQDHKNPTVLAYTSDDAIGFAKGEKMIGMYLNEAQDEEQHRQVANGLSLASPYIGSKNYVELDNGDVVYLPMTFETTAEMVGDLRVKKASGEEEILDESANLIYCSNGLAVYYNKLDENGKPDSFLIANFYEKEQVKRLYTSADLLHLAYEQTGYFVFSHEERLMPVSDNERMAIQHRLAKKKRAELIVRKLEEMEKMSRATDKKIQKRYQRMLMNLITSTADRYIYDCFCRFGAEFVREADYNENKLRTALNVSSEHTIKKSGQMRTYIQRAFPVGAEISVQEAKSMLRQVYKKMGLNTGRGITTKELEQYAEIENSRNREARMIKILKHK